MPVDPTNGIAVPRLLLSAREAAAKPMLSPPAVARKLGVCPSKILRWIKTGQLRGIDISETPGTGRPRYRVDPLDLATFLDQRSVSPPSPSRRRRRQPDGVHQYF